MPDRWDIRRTIGDTPFPETIIAPIDGAEMVLVPHGYCTLGISREELARIYD